jgi:hypothetical protein
MFRLLIPKIISVEKIRSGLKPVEISTWVIHGKRRPFGVVEFCASITTNAASAAFL